MDMISDSDIPTHARVELAVVSERTVREKEDSADDEGFQVFGEDGFTFLDFLDIINPLQHIPFIGTLYRNLTGDTLDPGSQVLGSTLFFGPVGAVASLANVWLEDNTGKDIGDHVMAVFTGEDSDSPEVAEIEGEIAAGEIVADVGAGAQSSQPATWTAPKAAEAAETIETAEAVDPVTAWARAETAYRMSAGGKSPMGPDGNAPRKAEAIPHPERAAIPASMNPT